MKTSFLFLNLFIFFNHLYSQERYRIFTTYEFGRNQFKMDNLNDFLLDSNYNGTSIGVFNISPQNQIKSGYHIGSTTSYSPFKNQSFGLSTEYQFGQIKRSSQFSSIVDPITQESEIVNAEFTYKTNVLMIGINSLTTLDPILFKNARGVWNHANLALSIQGGCGYSTFKNKSFYSSQSNSVQTQDYLYHSYDFYTKIALQFEYDRLHSKVLSGFGVKGGYQFLKTKYIHNNAGDIIVNTNGNVKLNLDFSGLFLQFYIKIGD
jgi:hypothetical protein